MLFSASWRDDVVENYSTVNKKKIKSNRNQNFNGNQARQERNAIEEEIPSAPVWNEGRDAQMMV